MRMLLLLCVFAAFTRSARADDLARSQPMPYVACLTTVQQLIDGTQFSRLLTTRDVQVVKIEFGDKNLVVTCDRPQETMSVRVRWEPSRSERAGH